MKNILMAAAIALSTLGIAAAPVQAGSSCYPSTASRSGDYVTYSAYGVGPGSHRVQIVRNGIWTYGPWVSGSAYSRVTKFHPGYTGVHMCVVQT